MTEPIPSSGGEQQDNRPVYEAPQVVELGNVCEAEGGNAVCGVGSSPLSDCTGGAAF
jgi:hypothetical protein